METTQIDLIPEQAYLYFPNGNLKLELSVIFF
jgi:hypothetical protein